MALCSCSTTEREIQRHILQVRELQFQNRLLMREAVSKDPKTRSVFDAAYASNIFVSLGSKPFGDL